MALFDGPPLCSSDLQQFLPHWRQNLHNNLRVLLVPVVCQFALCVYTHSPLVFNLHCILFRKRQDMMTIVIVLVVLFLLGGGGWGYSRWRG
jgi:hypothetical protein